MSDETKRVDVLAVMDECIGKRDFNLAPMIEARAAVAELIEAATEVDSRGCDESGWSIARQRLHAALSRIGGQS